MNSDCRSADRPQRELGRLQFQQKQTPGNVDLIWDLDLAPTFVCKGKETPSTGGIKPVVCVKCPHESGPQPALILSPRWSLVTWDIFGSYSEDKGPAGI